MSSPQPEPLEKEVPHVLEEARMVLPGVQALFGFQLVAVYNAPFKTLLSGGEQRLHLIAVFLTVLTVVMMMTPAAYRRQVEPHAISRGFVSLASYLGLSSATAKLELTTKSTWSKESSASTFDFGNLRLWFTRKDGSIFQDHQLSYGQKRLLTFLY